MNCMFRACKFNQQGVCGKYKVAEEMVKDFENGGGCALTWFFSLDKYPSKSEVMAWVKCCLAV